MTIRMAKEEDFDNLVRMAERFHGASPYSSLPFDKGGCRNLFDAYLRNNRECIILMFDHGMIIGYAMSPVFSKELIATEVAWWVDEEYRGSKDSLLLMKAYEDWALRIGASVCQMAMLDESTDLDKFYRRQGFKPAEKAYMKEFNKWQH